MSQSKVDPCSKIIYYRSLTCQVNYILKIFIERIFISQVAKISKKTKEQILQNYYLNDFFHQLLVS